MFIRRLLGIHRLALFRSPKFNRGDQRDFDRRPDPLRSTLLEFDFARDDRPVKGSDNAFEAIVSKAHGANSIVVA